MCLVYSLSRFPWAMLNINNQDDCYLSNHASNYQYGFLSSQFVPALLWMETRLLSDCTRVPIVHFQFLAINSMNLADLSDKAAKKKKTKPRQKETKEGTGDHRTEQKDWREKQGQVLPKSAQPAPPHHYLRETDAWDTEQPACLQMRAAFLSIPALNPAGLSGFLLGREAGRCASVNQRSSTRGTCTTRVSGVF